MSDNLTLFVINGSSSDAVVALGAHLGLKFDVRERRNNQDALSKINSALTVPTLVDHDGFVLTETSAILNHLARTKAPELLGRGNEERARNEELLSLLSSTVTHAYLLHFRPDKSADGDDARFAIKRSRQKLLIMCSINWRIKSLPKAMLSGLISLLQIFCSWCCSTGRSVLM